MRCLAVSALAVVFALTGCRDYVVNPVQPPAPAEVVGNAYIKGPSELRVGAETQYKAERFENARYDWRLQGPVTLESEDVGTRYLDSRATLAGVAQLEVLVFDADSGELIARGTRDVEVTSAP